MEISYHRVFSILLFLLLHPFSLSGSPIGQYCNGSLKGRNQAKSNVGVVLADLAARAPLDGFAVSSSKRTVTNTIYGLAQCRGDVGAQDCSNCIADAAKQLPISCPDSSDARLWYDFCFMRYQDQDFVGRVDTGYAVIWVNTESESADPDGFDRAVGELMTRARAKAAAQGSRGLGREKAQFTPYVALYGLAQCTRDLPPMPCAQCLAAAVGKFPDYCKYRKGCQINYSSCTARYEIYPFFFPLDSSATTKAPANVTANMRGTYTKLILYPQ